eukprot:TRINITY_DN7724_c0_g1_i1.p1 TRINITY_DN7724_c0_g1~~TRINITY_DN7724_c0_g1_i1.p1  ORF type:complete len:184 (+),score=43.32 TRINITY_DN7724_c0_g1_i1:83-553(+)
MAAHAKGAARACRSQVTLFCESARDKDSARWVCPEHGGAGAVPVRRYRLEDRVGMLQRKAAQLRQSTASARSAKQRAKAFGQYLNVCHQLQTARVRDAMVCPQVLLRWATSRGVLRVLPADVARSVSSFLSACPARSRRCVAPPPRQLPPAREEHR